MSLLQPMRAQYLDVSGPILPSSPQICSVGWEPNPGHAAYLGELESHYRECGYRVTIHSNTGVGVANTQAQFARLKQVIQGLTLVQSKSQMTRA